MWLQFEAVRGPVGVVSGRFGLTLCWFGVNPGPGADGLLADDTLGDAGGSLKFGVHEKPPYTYGILYIWA